MLLKLFKFYVGISWYAPAAYLLISLVRDDFWVALQASFFAAVAGLLICFLAALVVLLIHNSRMRNSEAYRAKMSGMTEDEIVKSINSFQKLITQRQKQLGCAGIDPNLSAPHPQPNVSPEMPGPAPVRR